MATASTSLLGADLSFGLTTQLQTKLVDPNDATLQSPDPWARPLDSDTGFELATISTDIRVVFHRQPQSRTVWLVIDPATAPLTGDYVVEVDATVVTYDATAGAPADVDALLTAIAAEINADGTVGPLVTATRVKLRDTSSGGSYDAIRLVAAPSAAAPAIGLPAGTDYATFSLGASTAMPELAALHIVREVDSASAKFWTRAGHSTLSTVTSNLNAVAAQHIGAWVLGGNGDIGALDADGYDDRANMASRAALYIQLYAPVTTDEALTIASSGDGIYGVTNWATVYAAPAIETT